MRRRALLLGSLSVHTLASTEESTPALMLDTSHVRTLDDLIAVMRKAAGDRLPANLDVKAFYRAFAKTFVEHAQDAIAAGVKIPRYVREQLPHGRKTVFPILVTVVILGVTFLVPLQVFFEVVVVSLALMWFFIHEEIKAMKASKRTA